MEFLALALPLAIGATVIWLTKRQVLRLWAILLTTWLCVPLGLISWLGFGFLIKDLGACHAVPGREIVGCVVFGIDMSTWMNGLTMGGYALALVALPWFLVGSLGVGAFAIAQMRKSNRGEDKPV